MSPAQSRWFFVGFTAVLAVVAVNAHRQPSRTAAVAHAPALPVTKAAVSKSPMGPAPASIQTHAPAQAPAVAAKGEPSRPDPVRVEAKEPIRLAVVSEPVRVQARLPSAGMVGQLPLPSAVDGDAEVIRMAQKELVDAGYGPLLVNGDAGPLTRAAVMAFEHDQAMALSGEVSERLLRRLRARDVVGRQTEPDSRRIVTQDAEQVVIIVQKSLQALGRVAVQIDGRVGGETEAAIRAFEADAGLKPGGRISADLFGALARAVARSKAE